VLRVFAGYVRAHGLELVLIISLAARSSTLVMCFMRRSSAILPTLLECQAGIMSKACADRLATVHICRFSERLIGLLITR
jgi:hypothetical protein